MTVAVNRESQMKDVKAQGIFRRLGRLLPVLLVIAWSMPVPAQEQIAPGASYYELSRAEGPWAIQVLDMQKGVPTLDLGVELGGEHILEIEPLTRLAGRIISSGHHIVAGINGDFYILQSGPFQGDPVGFCVVNGELVSSPISRSALVILEDGTLSIDRFRLSSRVKRTDGSSFRLSGVNQRCPGNGIVLLTPRFNTSTRPQENAVVLLAGPLSEPIRPEGTYTVAVLEQHPGDTELAIPPDRIVLMGRGKGAAFLGSVTAGDSLVCTIGIEPSAGTIRHAVGGGPRLLRNGEVSIEAETEGISQTFVDTRHPRTAVGFNGDHIFLVTVDGRQKGYSEGMNLHELASFLKELGATEAINLDGGGSTTMWVDGQVRNRPSDGIVRSIANALILYTVTP
ncbi:phosphodiester glycosidase family protein [bacterium]|nr:phosphodiester glycosidase family protein [bacterium]